MRFEGFFMSDVIKSGETVRKYLASYVEGWETLGCFYSRN